jgi:hypothetical protein
MRDLPELIVLDVGHGNCALLRDTEAVTVIDCPPTTTLLDTLTFLFIQNITSKAQLGNLVRLLARMRAPW